MDVPKLEDGFHTFSPTSTALDTSLEVEVWKREKTCQVCELKLTNITGDLLKRHGCKFCMHAVCGKCAPLRWFHSNSGRLRRICLSCLKQQMEFHVRAEFEASRPEREREWLETSQLLQQETTKRAQLESKLADFQYLQEEHGLLKVQLSEETQKRNEAEQKLAEIETELLTKRMEQSFQQKNFETSLLSLQQSVEKYRKTLVLKTAELMGMRKQVEQYKAVVEELKKGGEGKKGDLAPGLGMALSTAKQLHSIQVAELNAQVEDLKAKLQSKSSENDLLAAKLRDTENSRMDEAARHVRESQISAQHLKASATENDKLKREVVELREQLDRLAQAAQLDSSAVLVELQANSDRQTSTLKATIEGLNREKSDLNALLDTQREEIARLQELYDEQASLLSLAKEDVLSENQQKLDLEAKMQRFAQYLDQLKDFDQMTCKLSEANNKYLNVSEQLSRQRLETEQFKHMLRATQEALDKCEELIRAGQEQLQTERRIVLRRDAEIEEMKKVLQVHGLEAKVSLATVEGDSGLTELLREKEEKVGRLGLELQSNLQRLKVGRDKRANSTSGSQRGLPFKPPVSTEPCACAIF